MDTALIYSVNVGRTKILFILFFSRKLANRFIFARFPWYPITAIMAQQSQRGKRRDERSTEDGMALNSFECKWLECGSTNCEMWMSMVVPSNGGLI